MTFVIWVASSLVVMAAAMTSHASDSPEPLGVCRDRLGLFTAHDFKTSACSMCYFYLILNSPSSHNPVFKLSSRLRFRSFHFEPIFLNYNQTGRRGEPGIYPTYDNQTSLDLVCASLDEEHCTRWSTCCHDAWSCCQQQLQQTAPTNVRQYCPQTFDGWACWNYTLVNQTVSQTCPSFLAASENSLAYKTCDPNGSWTVRNETTLEYTDYSRCVSDHDISIYKAALIISIVLNSLGIILILPAIALFLNYRQLRKQQRIQIHLNLFLALLLMSVFSIVWDVGIKYDRINNSGAQSVLHSQQNLCKALNVIQRLSRATTFFWMSCEGFYLHRLMVNAFLPAKHFIGYLLFGWGVPTALFVLYAILRKTTADDDLCWLSPLEGGTVAMEWVLVFVPTILCIVVNLIFLVNILRILLHRMVSHPNEPSNFRKALRATLVLIPLFGLHQFCLIYPPSSTDQPGYDVFEIFAAIIINSQGAIISLVFCYFNGEMQSHIRSSWTFLRRRLSDRRGSGGRKLSLTNGSANASRRTSLSSVHNGGLAMRNLNTSVNVNGKTNEAFTDIGDTGQPESVNENET